MKPGCFLKSVIVLTIIVAAIMYIIQHKSELFFHQSKKVLSELYFEDWDKEFKYVKNTPEKSELKNSLRNFIDSLEIKNIPDKKEIDRIVNMVKAAALDSIISSAELKEISKNLKQLKNERPE